MATDETKLIAEAMADHSKKLQGVEDLIKNENITGASEALRDMLNTETCDVCAQLITDLIEGTESTVKACEVTDKESCRQALKELVEKISDTKELFTEVVETISHE